MQILQLQTDEAGNQGWVKVADVPDMPPEEADAYVEILQEKDGNQYIAQMVSGRTAAIIGES
jgi:hypothetical protein